MSEIKPEHVSKEFLASIYPLFEQICPIDYGENDMESAIAAMLNILQQHGFTVLKPGELYWVEIVKGWQWNARGEQIYEISYSPIQKNYLAYPGLGLVTQDLATLEAAKAYCQQLEDQARKGNQ